MIPRQLGCCLGACLFLLTFSSFAMGMSVVDSVVGSWGDLSSEQGYRVDANHMRRRRLFQEDQGFDSIDTVRGIPPKFTIRPVVDSGLCVNRVTLTSPGVLRSRVRSGLPPPSAEEIVEHGTSRLLLLPCANNRNETFTAENLMGRFYQIAGGNYRQGMVKHPWDLSVCMYGVNSSYTDGHPVFGVTNTEFYEQHASKTNVATLYDEEDEHELDWFEDYTFNYAPYIRYGYDPAKFVNAGSFKSPNPLPATMLDASGWGPFHTSWGPCMENPLKDSATPVDTSSLEAQLKYHAWIFVDVPGSAAISHLPNSVRKSAYALVNLGPDRPQPDMSPLAGSVDAGTLSAELGGGDKPYGTGYSALVSNELCLTTPVIKEGAEVRWASCTPATPRVEQIFQLVGLRAPKISKKF